MIRSLCAGQHPWLHRLPHRVRQSAATVALALLAVAGNVFQVSIFSGVDLLFGSVAALLALVWLGVLPALAVAMSGGALTWMLWGHPLDLVIYALEIAAVTWHRQRACSKFGSAPPLAVSVAWYWVLLGIPLTFLLHLGLLGMGWTPTLLIALKQALNGLLNAALAELILILVAIVRHQTQTLRIANLFFTVLLLAILLPSVGTIAWTNADLKAQMEVDQAIRMRLLAQTMAYHLNATKAVAQTHWDRADLSALDPNLSDHFLADAKPQMHLVTPGTAEVESRQQLLPTAVADLKLAIPAGDVRSTLGEWRAATYRLEVPVQVPVANSKLVVTVAQTSLFHYLQSILIPLLSALLALAIGAVIISARMAQWVSHSLGTLMVAAQALPEVIKAGIPHPVTLAAPLFELGEISAAVNQIADSLGNKFSDAQAERRYLANVLAGIHAGAWEWNLATDEIRINTEWANILGYLPTELEPITTATWMQLTHPNDLDHSMVLVEQQLRSYTPFLETEYRMRHRDGHWVWIQARGRVMEHDDSGAPLLLSGIHLDISGRKQTELALAESRQRFADIAEASADWLWEVDANGRYTYASDGVDAVLGYSAAEIIGRRPFDFMLLDEARRASALFAERAAQGAAFRDIEATWLHRDGRLIVLSTNGVPIKDADGQVLGYRGVDRNITERVQLETTLRQLSMAVEQSPESIVITDGQGRVEYVNDAFVNSSGYSRQEIVGRNPSMLQSGQTPRATYADMWRTLKQGHIWRGEFINKNKAGEIAIKHVIISPIRQPDGSLTHYLGMQEDVTEKKRLAEELDRHQHHLEELVAARTAELTQARAEAQRLAEVKGEFLANMSHELRTPMNAVLGLAYLLSRQELPLEAQQLARKIHESGQNLLGIINDILDLSKIEADKIEFEHSPFRLTQVLDNLATVMAGTVKDKHKNLKLVIIPPVCSDRLLLGDALRLGQILINLANNAIKFTEEGLVAVRIDTQDSSETQVTLRFAVRDTGIGIDADTQARLFQPFTQADASTTRRFGGTGLGLVIVRRLVELMGGALGLDSIAGQGSTFWFELPFEVAHDDTLPARAPLPMQVLVVTDQLPVRDGLLAIITALGWSGRAVSRGDQALTLVRDDTNWHGPNAAVLLGNMLGPCGLSTAKAIRAAVAESDWPLFFALTPHLVDQAKDSHGSAMVDAVLAEPLTPTPLYDAVVRAQHRRRGERTPQPISNAAQRLAGVHLLVVDDADTNREVARRIFADEGAQVSLASNGQEALDWLLASPNAVDAVLMDVQMPVMDGLQATRHIRHCAELAQLPVIALTAGAMATQEAAARDAGMDGFLPKPFDVEATVAIIQQLVTGTVVTASPAQPDGACPATDADLPGLAIGRGLALWKDPAVYRRYLRQMAADWRDAATRIAAAEPADAKRLAHALKGVAGNLGLVEVCALAEQLQHQFAAHDSADQIAATRTALQTALETAFASIDRYAPDDQPASARSSEPSDSLDPAVLVPLLRDLLNALTEFDIIGAEPALNQLADLLPAARIDPLRRAIDALDASGGEAAVRELATQLGVPIES